MDLESLIDEAEQQAYDDSRQERRAILGLIGFFLCVVAGGWLDQVDDEHEPSPITYVTLPEVKYMVRYSRNEDAVVFVNWSNEGETWK